MSLNCIFKASLPLFIASVIWLFHQAAILNLLDVFFHLSPLTPLNVFISKSTGQN